MKPSIGRIVHYVSYGTPGAEYGKECRAAIVTEVLLDEHTSSNGVLMPKVGLCVLNPTGQFFSQGVSLDDGRPHEGDLGASHLCDGKDRQGGTWHWPERVEG